MSFNLFYKVVSMIIDRDQYDVISADTYIAVLSEFLIS